MRDDAWTYQRVRLKKPPVLFATFDDFLAACGITSLVWLHEHLLDENESWDQWFDRQFGRNSIQGSPPFGSTALLKNGVIGIEPGPRTQVASEASHEALHNLAGDITFDEEGGMLVLNRALASGIQDREDCLDALCRQGFSDIPLGHHDATGYHPHFVESKDWKGCVSDARTQNLVTEQGYIAPSLLLRMEQNHERHPDTKPDGFEIANPYRDITGH